MILVNVLVALALGAALVTLMLTSQDDAIDRARRAGAAAQAEALALGAETSVLVALRRDMVEAPETDSYGEPWAQAAQAEVELETGRFAVTIHDAQAGLDLNGLRDGRARAGAGSGPPRRGLGAAAGDGRPDRCRRCGTAARCRGSTRSRGSTPRRRPGLRPSCRFLPTRGAREPQHGRPAADGGPARQPHGGAAARGPERAQGRPDPTGPPGPRAHPDRERGLPVRLSGT